MKYGLNIKNVRKRNRHDIATISMEISVRQEKIKSITYSDFRIK